MRPFNFAAVVMVRVASASSVTLASMYEAPVACATSAPELPDDR
jgi:hypothetical protein